MRPPQRTDVFFGCCVHTLEGHDERRPVPLLSRYLHVIPVSMILKCSGATKITDFSNTSEIALEQFQNCSRAAQSHRLSEEKLRRLSEGTRRRNERSSGRRYSSRFFGCPQGFSARFRFRLLLGWLHRDAVAFLEDCIIGFAGAVTGDFGHCVFLSHMFLS